MGYVSKAWVIYFREIGFNGHIFVSGIFIDFVWTNCKFIRKFLCFDNEFASMGLTMTFCVDIFL